jgi:hypothetical protein
LVTFSLRAGPRGTGTETISPRFLPSSALPIGDSFDSFRSATFASAEPTMWNFSDFEVFWSFRWTVVPTVTVSPVTSLESMTLAERSFS